MKVEVVVFASLRRYVPDLQLGKTLSVEVEPGTKIADIISQLNLPPKEVKIIMRNSLQADPGDEVADGDRVGFFPAVAGG